MKSFHFSKAFPRLLFLAGSVFGAVLFAYSQYIALQRAGAFGCFDDCFNFGAGYFLLQGKILYKDIFFNHQPLMAYISAVIQGVSRPQTLYQLVFYHRLFIVGLSVASFLYFVLRYRWVGLGTLVLWESTKYYLFGNRFLAESVIVYPLLFLFFLLCLHITKKRVFLWEYAVSGVAFWFVVWSREPYIPLAAVLYAFFIITAPSLKMRLYSVVCAGVLSLATLCLFPFGDYYFNVVSVNAATQVRADTVSPVLLLQAFFYPFLILAKFPQTVYQWVEYLLTLAFLASAAFICIKQKRWKYVGTLFLFLGLANLRVVPVGRQFFDAFHEGPWFCLLAASTAFMISGFKKSLGKMILIAIFTSCCLLVFIHPDSYIFEKVNGKDEFTNNYTHYFVKGEVIRLLSRPGDTMYVEMWEDPIYFTAGLPSAYRFSWYTSVMPLFGVYTEAREDMFAKNPPTFYIGACRTGEADSFPLRRNIAMMYTQLLIREKPSCVYVKTNVIERMTSENLSAIAAYGFSVR